MHTLAINFKTQSGINPETVVRRSTRESNTHSDNNTKIGVRRSARRQTPHPSQLKLNG